MNKHLILTAGMLIASWALTGKSIAQTYDANAAFKANELGINESNSSFGPFSVGYGLNFGDFTAFATGDHNNAFAGSPDTQGFNINNDAIVPAVVVNVGLSPGFSGLAPGEILAHPGGIGPSAFTPPFYNGVVRFIAPAAGLYAIDGNFRSLSNGFAQGDVVHNGTSLIAIGNEGTFRLTLQLAANDTVDFAVGAGDGGIGGDSTGLTAKLVAGATALQIVNIDFNGKRPGDAGDAGNYSGVSAAGIGTVFNGVTADSTGGDDYLSLSISGALNDLGQTTTVGFSISSVAGDHEPSQAFEPASLFDDYIFNNAGGNSSPGGSPFTISGLGDAATADLYFYLNGFNSGTISLGNFAGNGVAGNYNGLNARAFLGVPVVGGSVTGIFGANGLTSVLSGLTVSTTIGTIFWNVDASGLWSIGSNWVGNTAPNAVGAAAAFGGGTATTITAPRTITVDGAFTVGTMFFSNATHAYTLAAGAGANLTLDKGASMALVTVSAGSHVIQTPVTLTTYGASFNVNGATDTLTLSGAIGGSGTGLVKNGSGTLVVSNPANNYTGDTVIALGTLKIAAAEVIPHGAGKGGVNIGVGGSLDLGGFHETINRLSGTGAITSSAPAGKLTVGDASQSVFNGSITGPVEIEKAGAGVLTLNGTFDFPTLTTNGGVTLVKSALGSGGTTVNANATTKFTTSQTLAALNIGAGVTVTFGGSTVVVNIDLNGQRDGESSPGTYVGLGALGTGTVFNGVLVDSNNPAPNNDTLTISASGLLNAEGGLTTLTFGLANVGGDTNGGDILNDDYAFNNSAGNSAPAGSALTIGGLGGPFADIYLFLELSGGGGSGAGTTLGGLSGTPLGTVNGIPNVFFYDDVPVSGGTINGIFSAGGTGILNGLTIVSDFDGIPSPPAFAPFSAVPEPSSMLLLAGGFTALLGLRQRRA